MDGMRGDGAVTLEAALTAYEAALTVETRERSPMEWATLQRNLAMTLRDRTGGDRSQNLERALAACEQALTVDTREAAPNDWAEPQNAAAARLSVRSRGIRAG